MNLKSKSILDTITVILAILSLIICTLAIIIGFYQHKFFPLIYVGASYFTLTVYEMLIILKVITKMKQRKIKIMDSSPLFYFLL